MEPFGLLLLAASVLAAIAEMPSLSFTIVVVVLVNALLGFVQEWRAEKAVEALKRWIPQYAKAMRDLELRKIPVEEIVPGDVVLLEEGDRVPADARVFEAYELWTNNVPLTGESEPQPRSIEPPPRGSRSELESSNLVFMSTSVARGIGKALVTRTGMDTRFGRIAGLTQEIEPPPSPLQLEIAHLARLDLIATIAVGTLFFALGSLFLSLSFHEAILFMIGVMVACVPEGLQVTVSTSLALSVLRMSKHQVLVKRLSAVQTLGSTTVICTDKTGTITKGEMTAKRIWIPGLQIEVSGTGYEPIGELTSNGRMLEEAENKRLDKLVEAGALCNNSKIAPPSDEKKLWSVIGDPTDAAFLVLALKNDMNLAQLEKARPRLSLLPFDSNRKRISSIHQTDTGTIVYVKGAPRSILSVCSYLEADDDEIREMSPDDLSEIGHGIRELGDQGLRVIAIAYRKLEKPTSSFRPEEVEKQMVFLGLVGLQDPPRPEVHDAVRVAKRAGIRIIMLTGDYGPTAKSVAIQVGIVESEECQVVRGVDLERMSDPEVKLLLSRKDVVFARVAPEQKLRIVRLLRETGEIVAVTGDGANDAPSLKEADIGVAMGLSGTDVAREASDMVLLDDSFASIVKAVESGRTIFDNIRRFIAYVFAHNWAELSAYILFAVLRIPLPLLPMQVLAIDLGIDVLPSLALGLEPPEAGTMMRPPRSRKERLFDSSTILKSLLLGGFASILAMAACIRTWTAGGWTWGQELSYTDPLYLKGTTMTFAGIVVAQIASALLLRARRPSASESLENSRWILLGIAGQLAATLAIIYVPALQQIFGTVGIDIAEWSFLLALPITIAIMSQAARVYSKRRRGK
jgi:magnesium-transporting ATPase (P-type)